MTPQCPCCSGKLFKQCCARFLDEAKHAKTPEQLMRSRYSAFALGGYGNYLFDTWLGADSLGVSPQALNEADVEWLKLEIIEKSQQGDKAMVEFKAYHRENNTEKVLHERSLFQRIEGRWFYLSGEIF